MLLVRPLDREMEALVEAAGFDKSESGSEDFFYALQGAMDVVGVSIEDSHSEGLCYDATHALAAELYARTNGKVDTDAIS